MSMAASVDRDLIARALDALREHNWASGFAFEGASAPGWPALASQRHCDTRDTRDRAQERSRCGQGRAVEFAAFAEDAGAEVVDDLLEDGLTGLHEVATDGVGGENVGSLLLEEGGHGGFAAA